MHSIKGTSFHEATIVGVRRENATIAPDLEGVYVDGNKRNATVCLHGVHTITCDGLTVSDLVMEYQDGEILTLDYSPTSLHLIVDWTDFKNHHQKSRSYKISYDSAEIKIH